MAHDGPPAPPIGHSTTAETPWRRRESRGPGAGERWSACHRSPAAARPAPPPYGWAIRSRLEPIKKVARMIKRHWDGVINAVLTNVTNARSEGINAKIQWIKRQACGYRNRERFRNAIYFHLGGLDLYPDALAAHTNS